MWDALVTLYPFQGDMSYFPLNAVMGPIHNDLGEKMANYDNGKRYLIVLVPRLSNLKFDIKHIVDNRNLIILEKYKNKLYAAMNSTEQS